MIERSGDASLNYRGSFGLKMMLINLRSSVNCLLKTIKPIACVCGASIFLLASSLSAQSTTTYYTPSKSAGVWVESEWSENSPMSYDQAASSDQAAVSQYEAEPNYMQDGSDMPAYDSATAMQQYDASTEMASDTYAETYDAATWTEEPTAINAVVKNKNFFGIDKDSCCDEWSKFCKIKDMKFGCGCGGLKANKGHLGIPWLRSGDAGEDCDYCKGGCCKKGLAACREKRETRQATFSSAWNKRKGDRCDRCDNCAKANCPEEEGCTSCR